MGIKIGFLIAAVVLLFAFPFAAQAAGAPHTRPAGEPAVASAANDARADVHKAGSAANNDIKIPAHMLEWGVFGIAVGEFAGIMGRAFSQILRDRRAARREAAGLVQVQRQQPLFYTDYKNGR